MSLLYVQILHFSTCSGVEHRQNVTQSIRFRDNSMCDIAKLENQNDGMSVCIYVNIDLFLERHENI